jgi:membrane fusion protein (multidrug efflux system)
VLLSGSLVTVEVPVEGPRTGTLVPITALRRNSFGASVFVLTPAEEGARGAYRAERRVVELGSQRGDMVVVAAGIQPGERIAAEGSFKLRDGALVNSSSQAPSQSTGGS